MIPMKRGGTVDVVHPKRAEYLDLLLAAELEHHFQRINWIIRLPADPVEYFHRVVEDRIDLRPGQG